MTRSTHSLYKKFIYGLPILLFLGVCTSSYAYISILLTIAQSINQHYYLVTTLPLSYAICTAIIGLFIGVISDKFGRKNTILISLLLALIASIAMLMTKNIAALIIFAGLQGFATASLAVVLRLILKDKLNKDQQLFINGYLLTGVTVAPVLAPILGSYLVHIFVSYKAAFGLTIITSICAIVLTIIVIPNYKGTVNSRKLLPYMLVGFAKVIKHKRLRLFIIMIILSFCSLNLLILNVPFILEKFLHLSSRHSSLYFIVLGIGYFIGVPITNQLKKRGYSFYNLITLGLVIMVISLFLFLFLLASKHNDILFLLILASASTLFRIGQAILLAAALVQIMHEIEEYASLAAGLSCALIYVGSFIGIGISSLFNGNHINGMIYGLLITGLIFLITLIRFRKLASSIS